MIHQSTGSGYNIRKDTPNLAYNIEQLSLYTHYSIDSVLTEWSQYYVEGGDQMALHQLQVYLDIAAHMYMLCIKVVTVSQVWN